MTKEAICGWYSIVMLVKLAMYCIRKLYLEHNIREIKINVYLLANQC